MIALYIGWYVNKNSIVLNICASTQECNIDDIIMYR